MSCFASRVTARPIAVISVLSLSVGAVLFGATSASAAIPGPGADMSDVVFDAGPVVSTYEALQYGSSLVAGAVPIAPDTTTIVIQTVITATAPTVTCQFGEYYPQNNAVLEASFSAAEWNTGSVELDVTGLSPSTEQDYVFCENEQLPGTNWGLYWLMPVEVGAPTTVTLTQDPEQLYNQSTSADYFDRSSPARVIHAGDTVSVVATPGTWIDGDNSYVLLLGPNEFAQTFVDFTLSQDLSTLAFTLPEDLDEGHYGSGAYLELQTGVRAPDSQVPSFSAAVGWSASVTIAPALEASVTSVALSTPFTLSFLPTKVTAAIRSDGVVTGTVVFSVDGVPVRTVAVAAASHGEVSVWLPPLARGRHQIVASYSGSADVAASVSAPSTLRVLF